MRARCVTLCALLLSGCCARAQRVTVPEGAHRILLDRTVEAVATSTATLEAAALCEKVLEIDDEFGCGIDSGTACWTLQTENGEIQDYLAFCRVGAPLLDLMKGDELARRRRVAGYRKLVADGLAKARAHERVRTGRAAQGAGSSAATPQALEPTPLERQEALEDVASLTVVGPSRGLFDMGASEAAEVAIRGLAQFVEERAQQEIELYVAERLTELLCGDQPDNDTQRFSADPNRRPAETQETADYQEPWFWLQNTCAMLSDWTGDAARGTLRWQTLRVALIDDVHDFPARLDAAFGTIRRLLPLRVALRLALVLTRDPDPRAVARELLEVARSSGSPEVETMAGIVLAVTSVRGDPRRIPETAWVGIVRTLMVRAFTIDDEWLGQIAGTLRNADPNTEQTLDLSGPLERGGLIRDGVMALLGQASGGGAPSNAGTPPLDTAHPSGSTADQIRAQVAVLSNLGDCYGRAPNKFAREAHLRRGAAAVVELRRLFVEAQHELWVEISTVATKLVAVRRAVSELARCIRTNSGQCTSEGRTLRRTIEAVLPEIAKLRRVLPEDLDNGVAARVVSALNDISHALPQDGSIGTAQLEDLLRGISAAGSFGFSLDEGVARVRALLEALEGLRAAAEAMREEDLSAEERSARARSFAGEVVGLFEAGAALVVGEEVALPEKTADLVAALAAEDWASVVVVSLRMAADFAEADDRIPTKVVEALTFAAEVAEAEDEEGVRDALEAFAAPVGSYREKFRPQGLRFQLFINAFVGGFASCDRYFDRPLTTLPESGFATGLHASVGLDLVFYSAKWLNLGLYMPLIDLGGLVALPLVDDEQGSDIDREHVDREPPLELLSIIGPGLFFRGGLGRTPLAVGFGVQVLPSAVALEFTGTDGSPSSTHVGAVRFSAFLAVDTTLFAL